MKEPLAPTGQRPEILPLALAEKICHVCPLAPSESNHPSSTARWELCWRLRFLNVLSATSVISQKREEGNYE